METFLKNSAASSLCRMKAESGRATLHTFSSPLTGSLAAQQTITCYIPQCVGCRELQMIPLKIKTVLNNKTPCVPSAH